MAQAGVDIQPQITFHEVHNYLSGLAGQPRRRLTQRGALASLNQGGEDDARKLTDHLAAYLDVA